MNELLSVGIFGNEAGEDEVPEFLDAYFVEKDSFREFWDFNTRFAVVRARKGLGKSALLAKSEYDKKNSDRDAIIMFLRGSDLIGHFQHPSLSDASSLINAWQQALCTAINLELGRRIKLAFSDTSITLVENSELAGYKDRNLVGCLLDRLITKLPISRKKEPIHDQRAALYQFGRSRRFKAWILIDDIDATFINSQEMRFRTSTFFSACRKMAREYDGLAIRASVRTDVWSVIKQVDESLDKAEQYITDISWSRDEALQILARKIHAFAIRNSLKRTEAYYLDPLKKPEDIVSEVFLPRIRWGGRVFRISHVLYMLSDGRPRWSAQLGKLALSNCLKANRKQIGFEDIKDAMADYGRTRLDDLNREHRHQCPKLSSLIEVFAGGPSVYRTAHLLKRIETKIFSGPEGIELEDTDGMPDALSLARFLFKIGFITGKRKFHHDLIPGIRFDQRVELLRDPVNLDDGLVWVIDPSYREVLHIMYDEY
jgi:hypothetical protein